MKALDRLANNQSGENEIVFWRKEKIYEQLSVKNPNIDNPYDMDWGWEMRSHDTLDNVIYIVEERIK